MFVCCSAVRVRFRAVRVSGGGMMGRCLMVMLGRGMSCCHWGFSFLRKEDGQL